MEADIKYCPDGLSPVLLIKVLRTVHKSRPLSIMLSARIVIVIVRFANTTVIYGFFFSPASSEKEPTQTFNM